MPTHTQCTGRALSRGSRTGATYPCSRRATTVDKYGQPVCRQHAMTEAERYAARPLNKSQVARYQPIFLAKEPCGCAVRCTSAGIVGAIVYCRTHAQAPAMLAIAQAVVDQATDGLDRSEWILTKSRAVIEMAP